jgi:hypothetical protein
LKHHTVKCFSDHAHKTANGQRKGINPDFSQSFILIFRRAEISSFQRAIS